MHIQERGGRGEQREGARRAGQLVLSQTQALYCMAPRKRKAEERTCEGTPAPRTPTRQARSA